MDKNVQTIQTYFELSDIAAHDNQALQTIISLFAADSQIIPASGSQVSSKAQIAAFFTSFFTRNQTLKHVFHTDPTTVNYKTSWAVAGIKKSGALFTLQGNDYYEFDAAGKISKLIVAAN
ncbi:nuclear transport factor 2 family protein [Loigolactobacillus binensis]|uniref:Nuclear transport factor 2 family protein n=1 Tax=Loigolactobacillus binensis TaxID=2559922 RepID=A0ABW3EEB6_9LACO|nr:nuclear transport factor 2 family protein [Loigolactobacillus binensis]